MFERACTNIFDVATYFLSKEPMSHKKLQKLCYYAQAWYLANCGRPLFDEYFEAWVHGPVSPQLYSKYRNSGWNNIPQVHEVSLGHDASVFLDQVYSVYGCYNGDKLEEITHLEEPWKKARTGYAPRENCTNIIPNSDMLSYYRKRLDRGRGGET